ncbi:MAG: phosphoribosylglycinamide formyltransferase [Burkholderiales bacterium]|nr:phosphoribosylglycinamide formyltransferase [Burkholderiales bacterium]
MKNIVVLISGRGSNFKSIYETSVREYWEDRYGIKIAGVISNIADAAGLEYARSSGIPNCVVDHKQFPTREAFEKALIEKTEGYGADLIVLAGFMRILTFVFLDRYKGKILNIHPSLLPSFPGLHTHQRALDAGVRIHGATVHFASDVLDGGAIIGQAAVPVFADDDADKLAARVLTQEHILYPIAVRLCATDKVRLVGKRAKMDLEASKELAIL